MPRTRPAATLPKFHRFDQVCGIDTMEVRNPLDQENPFRISHVICLGTRYHQGSRRQDMTATETFSILRKFWLKHFDAMEVLIMDQGTEFGADFQHVCQSRGILLVVTDLETLVAKFRRRATWSPCSKWHSRKRAVWKAPTTEAEVNELIDFTFAEFNRRVGRAGFSPVHQVFGTTTSTPVKFIRRRFH